MKDRKDPRAAPGPRQRAFQRILNRAAAYGLIAAPVCSLVLSPETQLIALAAFGVPMLFLSAAMTTMRPTTARLIPSLAELTRSDPAADHSRRGLGLPAPEVRIHHKRRTRTHAGIHGHPPLNRAIHRHRSHHRPHDTYNDSHKRLSRRSPEKMDVFKIQRGRPQIGDPT